MKRVIIFGSSGMAGHMVYHYLNSFPEQYDVLGISRTIEEGIKSESFDIEDELIECAEFLSEYKPHIIINCIGLLVRPCQDDPTRAVFVNSFWPHVLEDASRELNAKVIHISTDCIFDGKNGPYDETACPTETNWYGRSKALGEIKNDKDLTIRTSIIGPELKDDGVGLFEWFMRQTGEVSGFSNVAWNGVTTLELAKQIHKILLLDSNLAGLYHLVTDEPIVKGNLLQVIQDVYGKTDVKVHQTTAAEPRNKVLINNRKGEYNPEIPSYSVQLTELKEFTKSSAAV